MQDPMRAAARRAAAGFFAVTMLVAVRAQALPAFWDLDVTFDDEGTATGSFVVDTPERTPTDWSLAIGGGNEGNFPPVVLDPANSGARTTTLPGLENRITFDLDGNDRQLRITSEAPVVEAACEVGLDLTDSSGNVECFNCSPFRLIAAGQLSRPCLVGTTVQAGIFSDSGSGLQGASVPIVVEQGPGDLTQIGGTPDFPIDIDVEASSFMISIASTGFSDLSFNGVVVSDLDWFDRPGLSVADVFVESNIAGFTPDRVTFGPHEVLVNFSALSVNDGVATVALQVPEPASTLAGAASLASLVLLAWLRSGGVGRTVRPALPGRTVLPTPRAPEAMPSPALRRRTGASPMMLEGLSRVRRKRGVPAPGRSSHGLGWAPRASATERGEPPRGQRPGRGRLRRRQAPSESVARAAAVPEVGPASGTRAIWLSPVSRKPAKSSGASSLNLRPSKGPPPVSRGSKIPFSSPVTRSW